MKYWHVLILLALCVLISSVSAWGDDLDAWNYRKQITVNNTGSALTDYQLMFTVNRSTGTDSGSTVYLNGKCESDYDDIRFTTSDENTLCDYWIESATSTVATIWVEVPTIATGNSTLYLYYGNAGASAVSSGYNTFQFFDDFLGNDVNASIWSVTGTWAVSGGVASTSTAGAQTNKIVSIQTFDNTVCTMSRAKITTTSTEANVLVFTDSIYAAGLHGTTPNYQMLHDTVVWSSVIEGLSSNTYYIFEVNWGGSTLQTRKNHGSWSTWARSTTPPANTIRLNVGSAAGGNGAGEFDWVAVRKYSATLPTISLGIEEERYQKYIIVDFSGVPTSGNVPLTVYFTDNSTGLNATINTWQWSFGDSTANSTQENPAHTYTTSGLYDIILTITNTSFLLTNSTIKSDYINVTINPDAPTADFTVTETCGETTDTFYFIDFSTGGGLYSWNWSFGDGTYSELRNPTHQYSSEGTYDVNLTVLGAYGSDSLMREDLITIPCGAATPTPTPTPTGTGGGNVTEGNITYIQAPDQDYVPFPIWLAIVIVSIAFFGHSLIFIKNSDLTASLAALFTFVSAWLSNMIGYIDVQVTYVAEDIMVSPVVQAVHPPWLVYTMLIFAFVSVVNIFAAIYKVYLKPVPWNEIYDRKLPKWGRRK